MENARQVLLADDGRLGAIDPQLRASRDRIELQRRSGRAAFAACGSRFAREMHRPFPQLLGKVS